jgi:hypothetical protein
VKRVFEAQAFELFFRRFHVLQRRVQLLGGVFLAR